MVDLPFPARMQRLNLFIGDLALHGDEGTIDAHVATCELRKIVQRREGSGSDDVALGRLQRFDARMARLQVGKASAPLIWRTNAVFFSTASMHVTDHMGRMVARTTPGRPPPDPTS